MAILIQVYDKNNLKITFTLEKCSDLVQMLAQNYSNAPLIFRDRLHNPKKVFKNFPF